MAIKWNNDFFRDNITSLRRYNYYLKVLNLVLLNYMKDSKIVYVQLCLIWILL